MLDSDHVKQCLRDIIDGHDRFASKGWQRLCCQSGFHPTTTEESIHALPSFKIVELSSTQGEVVVGSACIDCSAIVRGDQHDGVFILFFLLEGIDEISNDPIHVGQSTVGCCPQVLVLRLCCRNGRRCEVLRILHWKVHQLQGMHQKERSLPAMRSQTRQLPHNTPATCQHANALLNALA